MYSVFCFTHTYVYICILTYMYIYIYIYPRSYSTKQQSDQRWLTLEMLQAGTACSADMLARLASKEVRFFRT